ncbi:MAG: TonB-dependent receptor, partial [Gemmatimonadales bacterium]
MGSPLAVQLALRVHPLVRRLLPTMVAMGFALAFQTTAFAQGATVTGRILDAELSEPLGGAIVELATGAGSVLQEATTSETGLFRLASVPPGRYTLIISTLGYETQRIERLSVGSAPINLGEILLVSRAFQLNPIVVTTSRQEEKTLESPAAVYTKTAEEIQDKPAATPAEHVVGMPGVDNVTTGLQQHNVVARGFNNVFSGALFVLTDNRWASVPSLRFNAYNLIPSTNDDIERIEMVLGPGSALYGPNVDKGVMHIITRSPLDHQGTTVSLVGGARGENDIGNAEPMWQGTLRHAGLFSDDVGYKLSAMYFTGNDWNYFDPVEVANRQAAIDAGANPDTLKIGARDFNTDRVTADARVDWRIDDESSLVFAGGLTSMFSSIEMTGLGSAQADNWTYWYLQSRFRRGNLFAQGYLNMSNAGDSYLLRDGNPVSDNSYLWAVQLQHAPPMGQRQRWVYGADLIRTVPRTDGSIHGRNEDNDDIWEVGGYIQSETELSPKFDLVLAARLDWHSVVDDVVFSPRAAVVYKPTSEHSFRATYNRAFSQPTSINFSLDLQSSPTLGPFADYGVRALGVPAESGLTFRRDCGGLCIRSPYASDPAAFLAADAIQGFWGNAVDGLETLLAAQGLPPLDPGTEAFLRSLDPTGQVGTVYKMFDSEQLAFGDILTAEQAAIDVAPLVPSITNTFEVGYKGLVGDRLLLGVDVYWQRIQDFI